LHQTIEEQVEKLSKKKEEATDETVMWEISGQITRLRNQIVEERKLKQYQEQAAKLGCTIEADDTLWTVLRGDKPVLQYWPSTRRYKLQGNTEPSTITNFAMLLEILEGKNPYANSKMPFGKYEGQKIADIPLDYLEWLRENVELYGNVKKAVDLTFDLGVWQGDTAAPRQMF